MIEEFLTLDPVVENWIGNERLLDLIVKQFYSQHTLCHFIQGEPKIGKTSFLNQVYSKRLFPRDAKRVLMIWVHVDQALQKNNFSHLFFDSFHKAAEEGNIGLQELQQDADTVDGATYRDEITKCIKLLLRDHNIFRIIVIVDDYELMIDNMEIDDILMLRSLCSEFDEFGLLITGDRPIVDITRNQFRRSTNQEIKILSSFNNLLESSYIGLWSTADTDQFFENPNNPIPVEAQSFFNNLAGPHPRLLKVACLNYLQDIALTPEDPTKQRLDRIRSKFLYDSRVTRLCDTLFERRQGIEKQELARILRGEPPEDENLVAYLENLGLIQARDGKRRLFSEAFEYWFGRKFKGSDAQTTSSVMISTRDENFEFDPKERVVRVGKKIARLSPTEARLLMYLSLNTNVVLSDEQILLNVWGENRSISVVEKTINRLRNIIEENPEIPVRLITKYGGGYRFVLK